jgi:dephospho-CoA kinase
VVGMAGSGKSAVSEYLKLKRKFGYVRFGQIVLDKVKKLGKKPSESLERKIREELRAEHGMAAMAKLNAPKIDLLIKKSDVIADSIYSWEEYLFLKEKFTDNLIIIAVYSPPKLRYSRLENRAQNHGLDPDLRFRSFSQAESKARDYAEIENLQKAGPIVMADYTLINNGTIDNLYSQLDNVIKKIWHTV